MKRIKAGVALAVINTILLSRVVVNPATRFGLLTGEHDIRYYIVMFTMVAVYCLSVGLVALGVRTEKA